MCCSLDGPRDVLITVHGGEAADGLCRDWQLCDTATVASLRFPVNTILHLHTELQDLTVLRLRSRSKFPGHILQNGFQTCDVTGAPSRYA